MPAISEMVSGEYHRKEGVSKAEGHKWPVKDVPGHFQQVPVDDLNIDHAYQRERINRARILTISSSWSWAACGCILVARREDGSLWVFDGQHRTLAAKKRGDIAKLPCLVFPSIDVSDEAAAFVDSNTLRGAMRMTDKYKALIIKRDPIALKVQDMLDEYGYRVSNAGNAGHKGTVACVAALLSMMQWSEKHTRRVFGLCVELFKGLGIHDVLFRALCYVDAHLEKEGLTVNTPHIRSKLIGAGVEELQRSISMAKEFHRRSGQKVWADGIVRLINRGKRTRRVPPCISE